MSNSGDYKVRWAKWVLGNRALVFFATLAVVILSGFGMSKIEMSSDYRYFFRADNPQRMAFEKMQKVYTRDDTVIIAVAPKKGDIFNADTLKMINTLTERAWKVPYSTRVDSIANFQNTRSVADDLYVRDLVREGDDLDARQLADIKRVAETEPLLAGQLVARNGKATAVTIRVNLPGKSIQETPEVAMFVRDLGEEFKTNYPDHHFYFSGMTMMNNAFNEASMKDMSTLTPLMYLILIVITVFFLKNIYGTLATLAVLFFSVIVGMGLAGHLGIPLTAPSSIAPTVILTLAIADSVHILKSIFTYMRKGMEKTEAIIEGLRVNFQPVFLTSLTTAIGFLSLNVAETPPLQDLGNITAIGVTFAFIFSITVLPVLISVLPVKVKPSKQSDSIESFLISFVDFISKYRRKVLMGTGLLALLLIAQIPSIKLNDQFVNYFSRDIEFRRHTDWITQNLAGVYQIEFDLKSGESQGITDGQYLKTVDEFANMYRNVKDVTHVNSITDTFKRLNKNMHGDNPSYYRLPNNRELAAQYLLLYEMSLPYGLDLNNQINVDKSSTRVVVTFGDVDTTRMIELGKIGEEWLKNNAPEHMHTIAASPAVMFSQITTNNVKAMFWGTLFAFFLITLTLIIALRSVKYGLISLLPNIIPAGIAVGIWTLTVGEAGFAISVVFSVTLGIVVDDTVHFLSKYVRAKREKNLDTIDAVKDAFTNVGAALVATSVILVAGFGVMMLSSFKMNWVLGTLSAMTIAIALFIDFTFLPALLMILDKKKGA